MCKFDTIEDSNYVTVKNALACAVGDLLKDSMSSEGSGMNQLTSSVSITKRDESREQLRALRSYLGVSDRPDEYHQKVDGSCQWIDARDDFQDWRDCAEDFLAKEGTELGGKNMSIYWVHANPGTGKTVLASHVISQLQEFQLECAYYYFHVGNKASQSLGDLLRSISYQMAMSNAAIREKLFKLRQEGSTFDMDDSRTIWMKIFKKGILPASSF
jgi:Cdc6-like AAA superfamily ATPase